MSLSIGIVGLPNVGKSTLFKILTKKQVDIANYPFCTIDPNVGVVKVPDERLEKLAAFSHSQKIVPASVEFVDIAGLVKGAAEGEGLGNKFLSHIRETSVICEVVRVFKNEKIIHIHNKIDPENDIGVVETELIFADLETVERRIKNLEKETKSGEKIALKNLEIVKKIKTGLEKGIAAKNCGLNSAESESVKDLHLLTFKPILYVYNFSEKDILSAELDLLTELRKKNHIVLDIKVEEDILEMKEEEIKELGIRSNVDKLISEAYKLLGLITFFTTGEDETRAWTIRDGSTAPLAGRAIHSDFQEKFIRAEVINWRDLLNIGSYALAREKGLIRSEGKNYLVQDGDVIEFKI